MTTKAGSTKVALQALLGIPEANQSPNIGPLTRAAFDRLAVAPNEADWPPGGSLMSALPLAMVGRQISKRGLNFIKEFEGYFENAYRDGGGVWTIGWGHTGLQHMDGTVSSGRTVTRFEAEALLAYDMHQFETRVVRLVKVDLNEDEFAAMVSFDFNTGGLTLSDGGPSTMLKRLNNDDRKGAMLALLEWDKDNGQRIRGLTRRRQSEKRLFEGEVDPVLPA